MRNIRTILKICAWFTCMQILIASCKTPHQLSHKVVVSPDVIPSENIYTTPVLATLPTAVVEVVKAKPIQQFSWQEQKKQSLLTLLQDSLLLFSQVGMSVYDMTADSLILNYNADQRMRPASCEKVVTAISALHFLGGDYLLRTQIRMTGSIKSDGTLDGDLYVIGGMDPMLSKVDVKQMASALKQAGVKRIGGKMYIDVSMKDDNPLGWGWCWDDDYGPLTALTVDKKDSFTDEWLSALKDCKITVPVAARTQAERVHIDGVLLMPSSSSLKRAECPADAVVVAEITHTIDQLLQKMMKDSDNIYAESLFYQLASNSGAKKAGRKQAVVQINALLDSLGVASANYQIADGSGLSLYNYVSPSLLVTLLRYAYANEALRTHLLPSLPISGIDGTLKNRMKPDSPAYGVVKAKTGTVEGISSLSGYLTAKNGHVICFSFINQGVAKGSLGRAFQDRVCEALVR